MRYVGPRHIVIDDKPVIPDIWTPDRSLAGMSVVIIGSGPSLADLDLDLLRGHRFIVVNSGCRKVRPVATREDVLYFSDNAWNENRPELAADWPGPVITVNRNTAIRLGTDVRYLDVTELTERIGVMADCVQASSGHVAASLAVIMGARKLILVGFECCSVAGRTHGHDDYRTHDESVFFERFLPGWSGLARACERLGVDVVNAAPQSAIREFRFASLTDALREFRISVAERTDQSHLPTVFR